MIELLLLRKAMVLIGTAIATYTDLKDGMVYDKLTYPMILIGLVLNAYEFLLQKVDYVPFLMAAVVFGIGYLFYYTGKVGGGDVKLFVALTLLLPFVGNRTTVVGVEYSGINLVSVYAGGYPFVLAMAFVAAVVSVFVLTGYYGGRYVISGVDWKENHEGIFWALGIGVLSLAYFYFVIKLGIFSGLLTAIVAVAVFCALIFVAFSKGIKRKFFMKKVKLDKLEEDDLIAYEFLDEKTRQKLGFKMKGVIDKSFKEELKKLKLKEVPVFRNAPKFAPFVLIGEIIVLAWPGMIEQMFLAV